MQKASETPDDQGVLEAIGRSGTHVDLYHSDESRNISRIKAGASPDKPVAWMRYLKRLEYLRELELPVSRTEDDDLAYLVGLESLQKLEIEDGKFSDLGMKSIGAVASLRELRLVRCRTFPRTE